MGGRGTEGRKGGGVEEEEEEREHERNNLKTVRAGDVKECTLRADREGAREKEREKTRNIHLEQSGTVTHLEYFTF